MITDDYKERYSAAFKKDFDFSKAYSKDANRIILQELATIIDYECAITGQPHPMDLQGYDRQININFGFGVRTRDKRFAYYADFTVDLKELSHNITNPHYYYFYAYAEKPPVHKVNFWMIFDYRGLKRLANQEVIKPIPQRNQKHSLVPFNGYSISDLHKNNLIITYDGELELLSQLNLPLKQNRRIDRLEVTV